MKLDFFLISPPTFLFIKFCPRSFNKLEKKLRH
jgi:hypothetical protein